MQHVFGDVGQSTNPEHQPRGSVESPKSPRKLKALNPKLLRHTDCTWYMGVMPVPPAIMDSRSTDLPAPLSSYLHHRHAASVTPASAHAHASPQDKQPNLQALADLKSTPGLNSASATVC